MLLVCCVRLTCEGLTCEGYPFARYTFYVWIHNSCVEFFICVWEYFLCAEDNLTIVYLTIDNHVKTL